METNIHKKILQIINYLLDLLMQIIIKLSLHIELINFDSSIFIFNILREKKI